MTWTNTGGGDHEGSVWTPDNSTAISGTHYNISTFTVTTGYNIYVDTSSPSVTVTYNELHVYADTISVVGTINGDSRGYGGGGESNLGSGPGGGSGSESNSGGGGGYGGHGARGAGTINPGVGGSAYGISDSALIQRGSGGGGGSSGSGYRKGGNGGGCIGLYGNTITISGIIKCGGGSGWLSVNESGGGGSGGGIFLVGNSITVSGTLSANGGTASGSIPGGRGSGGRVKILYKTINTAGSTITAVMGTSGNLTDATDGTSTTTLIGQCNSTRTFGQTFEYGNRGILSKIGLYVNTITTGGDFTLKLWDDINKTTELASKTLSITTTGLKEFELSVWERLIKNDEYYLELNPDTTGDIELGIYGVLYNTDGCYYEDGFSCIYFDTYYILTGIMHTDSINIYNTTTPSVQLNATNRMLTGAIHEIDINGFGNIQYSDNFTTAKYLADYDTILNVTHDITNDEIDIADNGYITYKIDAKYPITGIPTLTSTIDITAGTPTLQISTDSSTWYDIDTAVVDNISTVYELDNIINLSLDQVTSFYYRFDCTAVGTNSCSIKSFTLDFDIITIDTEHPTINTGATNTFRCDQDSDSGINCTVELKYRDRSWA